METKSSSANSIINDAAVRRFLAQRIYMRILAVLRWVNARTAILQGQQPNAGHAAALQQIRNTLRMVSETQHE